MKQIYLIAVLAMLLTAGCASEPLVGESCGTVSPDSRDECCARQNEGKPTPMCVGQWTYVMEENVCKFVCG